MVLYPLDTTTLSNYFISKPQIFEHIKPFSLLRLPRVMRLAQGLMASWVCQERRISYLLPVECEELNSLAETFSFPSLSFTADGGQGRKLILSEWLPAEPRVLRRGRPLTVGGQRVQNIKSFHLLLSRLRLQSTLHFLSDTGWLKQGKKRLDLCSVFVIQVIFHFSRGFCSQSGMEFCLCDLDEEEFLLAGVLFSWTAQIDTTIESACSTDERSRDFTWQSRWPAGKRGESVSRGAPYVAH